MTEFSESLSSGLVESQISFTSEQLAQCEKYHELLIEWNAKMNLTAIQDPKEIAIKHFIDSLLCLKHVTMSNNDQLIDVGTGAGFPGIPIKIFLPGIRLGLLDSLAKRCRFLTEVVSSLDLKGVSVIHGRAEDIGKNPVFREQFSLVTARAVTNLSVLAEYCLPFLKVGGCLFALKGPEVEKEVEKGEKAISTMGGLIKEIKNYRLAFSGDPRSLILIEKVRPTPRKYPRKPGTPGKEPIC